MSSIKTSAGCFKDVEGGNLLLNLLSKTASGLMMICLARADVGSFWCSLQLSRFYDHDIISLVLVSVVEFFAVAALSWMLAF